MHRIPEGVNYRAVFIAQRSPLVTNFPPTFDSYTPAFSIANIGNLAQNVLVRSMIVASFSGE